MMAEDAAALEYDLEDSNIASLSGDPIINEARRRFDRCSEYEAVARQRMLEDNRFRWGDSDNNYQWPNAIRNSRDTQAKPCLTLNLVNRHNKMISNQARKNKASVKYVGMGNGATAESARVLQDIHRHIENQSQAQNIYTVARDWAVGVGIGWWRLTTEYFDDTFDQEIFIRPINDPFSVFMDPTIQQKNGLDSEFAFVFDDISKEEFRELHPDRMIDLTRQPLGMGTVSGDWVSRGMVRVCEYFRKRKKKDKLVSFIHQGTRMNIKNRHFVKIVKDPEYRKYLMKLPTTRTRDLVDTIVEWYKIAGSEVIEEGEWAGKYIPLIRCVGEESMVEGVWDCHGHTRWMKDAQRMFNYNASAQVEVVALQTKAPWLAAVDAIEEHETMWNTANVQNPSVLVWNHKDPETNEPIPPPTRVEPPKSASAYMEGMETAHNQIMMTSGQFQNQLGMMGNERTGAAIEGRQRQSDTANFHFQDNYEIALKAEGIMFIDLIPKIYDTQRMMHIINDDGVEYDLEIDPTLRQGYLEQLRHDGEVVKRIMNPQIGRFDIAADVGPEYGAKRQETAEALTLILTQAPGLTNIIGDYLLSSLDFDKANEAAARLRRLVPPLALGKGPTQTEQQQQQQIQALSQALQKSLHTQAKDQLKLVGKDQLRDIETYDAETKRLGALAKLLPEDPEGLRRLIHQLVEESLSTSLANITQENAPNEAEESGDAPPIQGAQKAPDGQWYMSDPTRPGKHLRIEKRGEAPASPQEALGARKAPDGNWYLEHPKGSGQHFRVDVGAEANG